MAILIRWALTLGLLWLVYTETGVWTAVSMGLIFLEIEVRGFRERR